MDTIRILYLEDNPMDVKLLEGILLKDISDYKISHCINEEEFKQMLSQQEFDLILADYYLPPYDGFKALEYIKQNYPKVPFILISGVAGEEIAVDALQRGAVDYIMKKNLSRISTAVHRAIILAKEKEQKLKAEDLRTKYDFIINTSRSFMSLIDRNYIYEAINNAFASAHNLVREEVVGKSLSEIWGESNFREIIKPNLDKTFADNEVHYQAWFDIPKHGKRFFEVTFYPFRNEKGEVSHTVVDTFDITESRITEEALRESEEKYRSLVENAQDGICILRDEKIIFANPFVFNKSGYTPDDIIGKPFWKFIHPVEKEKVIENYKKRMAGEKVDAKYDSIITRKDGSTFHVELNAVVIQYEGEDAELAILRDISERKESERILKQSQQEVLAIIENSQDNYWSIDKEYRLLVINRRFMKYFKLGFGITLKIGQSMIETLPVEIRETWRERYDKALNGENYSFVEKYHIRNRDFYFEVNLNPIKDSDKNVIGVSAMARDISDQKTAEAALMASEEKYRNLYNSAIIGLYQTTVKEGKVLAANSAVAKIFGYRSVTKFMNEFKASEHYVDPAQRKEFINNAIKNGRVDHMEILGTRCDGTSISLDISGNYYAGKGILEGVIIDITKRKEAEEALRESEEVFRSFSEQTPDGIAMADEEGKIIEWNIGLEQLCGIRKKEVINKPLWVGNAIMFEKLGIYNKNHQHKKLIQDFYKKGTAPWLGEIQETKISWNNDESGWIQHVTFPIKTSKGFMLGSIVRDITEQKESEETIMRHSHDLSLINDLNSAVNRGEDLENILAMIWDRFEVAFNSIGAAIYLLSEDKKQLILQRNQKANLAINQIQKIIKKKLDTIKIPFTENSIYWRTLTDGDPYNTNDSKIITKLIGEHELPPGLTRFFPQAIKLLGLKSFVNIPLFSRNNSYGILSIARKEPFSEVDINRLMSICSQITSILRRKSAEEKIQQHTYDLTLISDLNSAVNQGKSLQKILTILSKQTRRMFAGYGASIFLVSEDQKSLYPGITSLPKGMITKIEKLVGNKISNSMVKFNNESLFTRALITGEPTIHDSPKEIKKLVGEFVHSKIQKQLASSVIKILGLKHLVNIPMVAEDIPIGILNISKTEPFTQNDVKRLEYIASQVMSIIRRKRAEEDFFESEHKFKAIFETANDAIFLLDDNKFIDCNQRTLEIFRCTKQDIMGKTPVMLSPEFQMDGETSEKSADKRIKEAQKGGNVRFEWIHKRIDETQFHAEVSLNQLELKGVKYLQAIVRDISQRKEAEQEIIEKEKGLREAQRLASVGSWEWDMVNNKITWTDETYHILGLKKESTSPNLNMFLNTVKKGDQKRVRAEIQHTIENNSSADFFHDIVKPDGEKRSVHSRAEIVLDPFVKPIKFIGTIHDITDLRRAEKAFLVSEEKFRSVFEKGQFAMVLANLEGKLIQTNKAAQDLFGYSEEELTEMPFIKLTHGDDLKESKSYFNNLVLGKIQFFVLEKRYVRKDGRIIYCHIGVSSIKNEEGDIINTVGMITEVTEQKLAEQQIKHRTEELALINTMNSMVNAGDSIDEVFQYFARSIQQLYACHIAAFGMLNEDKKSITIENVSMESKIIRGLEKLVNAKVRKHYVKPPPKGLIFKCIHGIEPQLLDTKKQINEMIRELATKQATSKLIPEITRFLGMNNVCNFPLFSGNEKIGVIITARREKYKGQDIEGMSNLFGQLVSIIIRKRVEEERIKLSTVVEQMSETVVITDTKGNLQYANPAFEYISGFSREEAMNQNMNILNSGAQGKEFYHELWSTISKGRVWNGKITNKRKNGSFYEERATISPITNEEGKIVNYVAVKKDITRESHLENQLFQSQKLETVGTLARGIAHDFNNILGTILGYNDMAIEDSAPNEKVHKYLIRMKKTSLRARDLVNQILTFSRDFIPEPKPVKVQNLIKDSLTLFYPNVATNVKIKTKIDKNTPAIFADPLQIQQVILNLLTNANQAMGDIGGLITINTEVITADEFLVETLPDLVVGDYLKVSVSDTGSGMDTETQQKIFEPFFSTKPVGEGTGLGLSVVHGIIVNHKGVINVESESGKGTTFEVYLPV